MFRRTLVFAATLAVLVVAVPGARAITFSVTNLTAQYGSDYRLVDGHSFMQPDSFRAYAISPNGQYIAGRVGLWKYRQDVPAYSPQAFRYTVGQPAVEFINCDADSWATSVDNLGRVAGQAAGVNTPPEEYSNHAIIGSAAPSVESTIPVISSTDSRINGTQPPVYYASINSSGHVAATVHTALAVGEPSFNTYLMFYDGTTASDLGLHDQIALNLGADIVSVGTQSPKINDEDWIVGTGTFSTGGPLQPFINRPDGLGGRETIGLLNDVGGLGCGINNSKKIVGLSNSTAHAFLSIPNAQDVYGESTDLGVLEGDTVSVAEAIGNNDWIVGKSSGGSSGSRGFLAMKEGGNYVMHDLNGMLANSGWTIRDAYSMSDNGQILATASHAQYGDAYVLLTPVPEPSTFVLLAVAAVGLLGWARRQRLGPLGPA